MKVGEEIDALEVMGLNPIKFLVVPKFLAMILAVPMITVLAMFIMIFGAWVAGVVIVGVDSAIYVDESIKALVVKDLVTGLIKSFFLRRGHLLGRDLPGISGGRRSGRGGTAHHVVGGDLDLFDHHHRSGIHRPVLLRMI